MADEDQTAGGAEAQATGPQLRVLGQYIKDLSFENPNAPDSLRAGGEAPKIDVTVDVNARRIAGDDFEVSLRCAASARRGDQTAFIVETVYAGLFQLTNAAPEALQPILLIECPRILFPFARRVVADATRDGGFPPLMLDPIDFAALYQQQAQAQAAQGGAASVN